MGPHCFCSDVTRKALKLVVGTTPSHPTPTHARPNRGIWRASPKLPNSLHSTFIPRIIYLFRKNLFRLQQIRRIIMRWKALFGKHPNFFSWLLFEGQPRHWLVCLVGYIWNQDSIEIASELSLFLNATDVDVCFFARFGVYAFASSDTGPSNASIFRTFARQKAPMLKCYF